MMAGREAFGIGAAVHPPAATMQGMRLAFSPEGTPVYKPVTAPALDYSPAAASAGDAAAVTAAATAAAAAAQAPGIVGQGGNGGAGDQVKRKRGRPRKYGPDGAMALGLSPAPSSAGSGLPSPTDKKVRGRPPGSGRKQQLAALGSTGVGFTPHIITVKAGEDVSSKIMSFSQKGPRAICILSANGALSNVTLRQAASSGGTITLEGRYEILSLSGSFLLSESGGQRSRTGGLSVSLAGSDGRVVGGGVAGLLTAASPVQVVVGSFLPEGRKDSKSHFSRDPSSAMLKASSGGNTGGGSPPSRGTLSESSGGAGSPINQNSGAYNNSNSHGLGSMPWN